MDGREPDRTGGAMQESEPARLTLVLFQVDDGVRIEATAIQGGMGGDVGYTEGMVKDVFTTLDAQLTRSKE
jgi:hypothetical protein